MPRRSKASSSGEETLPSPTEISREALAVISNIPSSMSEKALKKLIEQIALPVDFEWILPSPTQCANDPPPGCLTVYASKLNLGLRFPLPNLLVQVFTILGIPHSQLLPNSYRLTVGFLLCSCLYHFEARDAWNIPLTWSSSLRPLPSLDLVGIKKNMIDSGLIAHSFNAKAIMGGRTAYLSRITPETMMNRAAVRKFIPDDVPTIPPSLGARSTSATPSDPPSSSVPRSVTPPRPQSYSAAFPHGTPVIEVVTSPEECTPFFTPQPIPLSSPVPPSVDATSSQKRPRPLEDPSICPSPPHTASGSLTFSAPVLTPRLDPKAGVFNPHSQLF
ncbi:hypothetical protein Salat_1613500 [Sesamum alatum]|uniref:Uncharacterized protein n=1 Tax=Sesamum alatum TaxID=300844 RepID=A0AAE1Y6N8_9LAMI|nr:hypothetical protein Salat_1613500 [Sesamum alatum]